MLAPPCLHFLLQVSQFARGNMQLLKLLQIINEPLEAGDPLMAELQQKEDGILSQLLVLMTMFPCENSVRTKYGFQTVLG